LYFEICLAFWAFGSWVVIAVTSIVLNYVDNDVHPPGVSAGSKKTTKYSTSSTDSPIICLSELQRLQLHRVFLLIKVGIGRNGSYGTLKH
jgi:hypothetical protein